MIFLLEEISTSSALITLVRGLDKAYAKAIKTKGGKFLGIGKEKTDHAVDLDLVCEIAKTRGDSDVIGEILGLCKSDRDVAPSESQLMDAYIRIVYKDLAESASFVKTLTSAVEQYGYEVSPTTHKVEFKEKFIGQYLNTLVASPYDKAVKVFLFSYLFVNYQKSLDDDAVRDILTGHVAWFKGLDSRDLKYKLDVYAWTQKPSNLAKFGIDKSFTFKSLVELGSKSIGTGKPFGELTVQEMRQWLNQFDEKPTEVTLFSIFDRDDLDNYAQVEAKYKPLWDAIDITKSQIALNYLKKLETNKNWKTGLKNLRTTSNKVSEEDLLELIVSIAGGAAAETSTSSSETTSEAPRATGTAKSGRARNGFAIFREIFGIAPGKNLNQGALQAYCRDIAKKNKVAKIYNKNKLDQKVGVDATFVNDVLKKTYKASKIDGVQQQELNQAIIDWIKTYPI